MDYYDKDTKAIADTVNHYFNGTYHGDAKQLQHAFHPEARIVGVLDHELFDWNLKEFIDRVSKHPTAAIQGEPFEKEIVFIDKTDDLAIVKTRAVVGRYTFIDYITLIKIDGHWMIRNKSFVAI